MYSQVGHQQIGLLPEGWKSDRKDERVSTQQEANSIIILSFSLYNYTFTFLAYIWKLWPLLTLNEAWRWDRWQEFTHYQKS